MSTTLSKRYAHLVTDMFKGIDEGGPYYIVHYLFDSWADSDSIPNEMMGFSQRAAGSTFYRYPHQHPLSINLFCRSARVIGQGAPITNANGYPSYANGFVIEAEYRAWMPLAGFDGNTDQQIDPTSAPILWATQELDYDTEVFTIPTSNYTYFSDGKTTDVPLKVEVGVTVLSLTFHFLPYIPVGRVRALRGRINQSTFLGAPPETVRFMGCKTVRDVNTDGSFIQRATLVFKERDQSWNKFLRADTMAWDYIQAAGAVRPYTVADFSPLITL